MNVIDNKLVFNGSLKKRSKTEKIILHHSGVTVSQSVETIHGYHKNSNGWAGIGYHYYIRKDGNVYVGRSDDTVGAHATDNNTNSIGVCFEGNFEVETMNDTQKRAGQELVSHLKAKYNISKIEKHNDVAKTSCPRKKLSLL